MAMAYLEALIAALQWCLNGFFQCKKTPKNTHNLLGIAKKIQLY
jgi:hypothetical protein